MALIHKSEHSLLASLGIALVVLTGIFAVLAINFRSKETTELRSRANFDQNPYHSPSPKVSPPPCRFAYRLHCYETQASLDIAKRNYEASQNVACFLPQNPFCPPSLEGGDPVGECPFQFEDHCYEDARDRDRAIEVSTMEPPFEAPVPIDQN